MKCHKISSKSYQRWPYLIWKWMDEVELIRCASRQVVSLNVSLYMSQLIAHELRHLNCPNCRYIKLLVCQIRWELLWKQYVPWLIFGFYAVFWKKKKPKHLFLIILAHITHWRRQKAGVLQKVSLLAFLANIIKRMLYH